MTPLVSSNYYNPLLPTKLSAHVIVFISWLDLFYISYSSKRLITFDLQKTHIYNQHVNKLDTRVIL